MSAIDDMERNIPLTIENTENLKDLLKIYLSNTSIGQKSRLTEKNIEGILSALSINTYLELHFGITNRALSKLVKERLEKSISLNGLGRQEINDFMSIIRETEQAQLLLEQEKQKI